jgi:peroxiredoxin
MKKSIGLMMLMAIGLVSFGQGYSIGDVVDNFDLPNTNDQQSSLTNGECEKGAIVIFTCNHCPYSVAYEDRIIALDKKYRSKGLPVIAINPNDVNREPDDSFEAMKQRAEEKGFPFDYAYDESQEVARAFGASRTPHVFLLEKVGAQFIVRYIGAIDDNTRFPDEVKTKYVEDAADALLKGKKIKTTQTKAIGCSIKWAS